MKQKVCKNKQCQKQLPGNYRHSYCEACRNKRIQSIKHMGEGVLALGVVTIGAIAKLKK